METESTYLDRGLSDDRRLSGKIFFVGESVRERRSASHKALENDPREIKSLGERSKDPGTKTTELTRTEDGLQNGSQILP